MNQTTQIQNHLEQGMNIITEMVTKGNKSYAKYRMEK